MKKIKVLIVAGPLNLGGIENQLMHLMRNIDRNTFQIDFTSTNPNSCYRQEIESLGGKFYPIPRMSRINPFPYCRILKQIMEKERYDVVHSHELFHSGIVVTVAALAKIPFRFVHAHNWCDDNGDGKKRSLFRTIYNALMRRLILRYSTCRIACSTLAGEFLYGQQALQHPGYHLIFNSVDTAKFLDRYQNIESGDFTGDGWINVLHVGRFSMVKNQMFLVELAAELRQRRQNIRILCAGGDGDSYRAQVSQMIAVRGVEEYIRLLGARSDIDTLMRKSSAFVLPSKYEGMPLVLIEAQASGLHCVCADTFSREVDFGIGTVRWMDPEADASAWADAVEAAVAAGRAEKAAVVRAVERGGFDSDSFAMKLCGLYRDACKGTNHD